MGYTYHNSLKNAIITVQKIVNQFFYISSNYSHPPIFLNACQPLEKHKLNK
jgi:hypothetical protein